MEEANQIKQNKSLAQLVPNEKDAESLFGKMKGSVRIGGDILSPIDEVWNACAGILLHKSV